MGRPHRVGTTGKSAAARPQEVVADEQITWLAGQAVVVPTTGGGDWVLGISVAPEATGESVKEAYREFVAAAPTVFAEYQGRSVCTAGCKATRAAWRGLCPPLTLVLCSLPALLKIQERGRGALRRHVLARAWPV